MTGSLEYRIPSLRHLGDLVLQHHNLRVGLGRIDSLHQWALQEGDILLIDHDRCVVAVYSATNVLISEEMLSSPFCIPDAASAMMAAKLVELSDPPLVLSFQ